MERESEKTGQGIFVVLLQKHDEIPYGAGRGNHVPHVGHIGLDDFSTMFGSKRCCEGTTENHPFCFGGVRCDCNQSFIYA